MMLDRCVAGGKRGWGARGILGALLGLTLLGGAGPFAPRAAAGTVDLMAKHRKALGGENALETWSAWTVAGTVSRAGEARSFRWLVTAPTLFREDVWDGAGHRESVATDGQQVWAARVEGSVTGLQGCSRRLLHTLGILLARGYVVPEDVGWDPGEAAERAGGEGWDLPVTTREIAPLVLTFDRKPTLLSRVEAGTDPCRLELTLTDYQKHGKSRFPHSVTVVTTTNGHTATMTYHVESVEPAPDLASDAYDRPEEPPRGFRFQSESSTVALPMVRDDEGRVLVDLTLPDGGSSRWLLDSGTVRSSLNAGRVKALGLATAGTWGWLFDGRTRDTIRYVLPQVQTEGLEIGPLLVVAAQAPDGADVETPQGAFGALGTDVLGRFVVGLRFSQGQVVFDDPTRFVDSGEGDALPLDAYDRVTVLLNARAVVSMKVATAWAGPPILLFKQDVARHGLEPDPARRLPLEIGERTQPTDFLALIDSVQVGGATVHNVPARFRLEPAETPQDFACSLLGPRFLERFDVTLDLPHRQYLVSPAPGLDNPFPIDRSGLEPVLEKGILVATRDGKDGRILAQDRLMAVKMGKRWISDPDRIVHALQGPEGTVVLLRVERGKQRLVRKLMLHNP